MNGGFVADGEFAVPGGQGSVAHQCPQFDGARTSAYAPMRSTVPAVRGGEILDLEFLPGTGRTLGGCSKVVGVDSYERSDRRLPARKSRTTPSTTTATSAAWLGTHKNPGALGAFQAGGAGTAVVRRRDRLAQLARDNAISVSV